MTAVSDPVRWTVLRQLSAGRSCVCDLRASVHELAADAAARMAAALAVALSVADVAQR